MRKMLSILLCLSLSACAKQGPQSPVEEVLQRHQQEIVSVTFALISSDWEGACQEARPIFIQELDLILEDLCRELAELDTIGVPETP